MMRRSSSATTRPGYTLIAVMLVVVVLSLAAYRFSEAMTAEFGVAVRSRDAAQAKLHAISGIHFAAGALSDANTLNNTLGGNPFDNANVFSNVQIGDPNGVRGGGRFSLISVADTLSGSGESRYQQRFGVIDEGGKWNINALIQADSSGRVLHDALMKLPNMTEEIADAIVDWVDADDTQRAAGAESAYYQGLSQSYRAKNAPLNSLDELLMVRGVTWQLLFGTDRNRNGRVDPGEAELGDFSRGWSEFLTCYGREINQDLNGNQRIFLNDPNIATDVNAFAQNLNTTLGQDLANYVLAAKLYGTAASTNASSGSGSTPSSGSSGTVALSVGASSSGGGIAMRVTSTGGGNSGGGTSGGNSTPSTRPGSLTDLAVAVSNSIKAGQIPSRRISSIMALNNTQVTLPRPPGAPSDSPQLVVQSPLNTAAGRATALPLLLEYCTTRQNYEITPRLNVNVAAPEVLAGLPGLTQPDVDQILAVRGTQTPGDPATLTGAWLVTQGNLSMTKFNAIERYVTGRSMTYRIQSLGYFGSGGPVARVEAVVDTNLGHPRFVYFRDLTDLGRGFDLPR
jgi:hypothetical protein